MIPETGTGATIVRVEGGNQELITLDAFEEALETYEPQSLDIRYGAYVLRMWEPATDDTVVAADGNVVARDPRNCVSFVYWPYSRAGLLASDVLKRRMDTSLPQS